MVSGIPTAGVLGRGENFKGEDSVVAHGSQQGDGLLEVSVRLAGKAYDHVAGDADIAFSGVDPAHTLQVPITRVFAGHRTKHGG